MKIDLEIQISEKEFYKKYFDIIFIEKLNMKQKKLKNYIKKLQKIQKI